MSVATEWIKYNSLLEIDQEYLNNFDIILKKGDYTVPLILGMKFHSQDVDNIKIWLSNLNLVDSNGNNYIINNLNNNILKGILQCGIGECKVLKAVSESEVLNHITESFKIIYNSVEISNIYEWNPSIQIINNQLEICITIPSTISVYSTGTVWALYESDTYYSPFEVIDNVLYVKICKVESGLYSLPPSNWIDIPKSELNAICINGARLGKYNEAYSDLFALSIYLNPRINPEYKDLKLYGLTISSSYEFIEQEST